MYKKQRNFCVNLLRKEKRNYYNNLDLKILEDNKKFWQCVKPLFSNKHVLQKNIIIIEKDIITSINSEVAEKLNNFFIEAVESLEIEPFAPDLDNKTNTINIDEIIKKYETHSSIFKDRRNMKVGNQFSFKEITTNSFKEEIYKLDPKKASMEMIYQLKF